MSLRCLTFKSQTEDARLPTGLFQETKRGANLLVSWTLTIIRFDLRPGDLPAFVDYVYGRMGNAIDLLTFVSRIAKSVSVDDFMVWIIQ